MPPTKPINTISRGAEILKILAEGCNRLEDIYPRVGLNKSTTHRLLKSLVSSGLSFQSPLNRNYYLGPLLLKLSSNPAVSHQMLVLGALEPLRKIRDDSGETAMIMIPNGSQRLVLKEMRSKQEIALSLGDGNTAPMVIGSSGRTLLSQYTDGELQKILEKINIISVGPETIRDQVLLQKEIDRIRKKGFGTSSGETHPDAAGISVPVKGYLFPVVLCVMGPKVRFKPMGILNLLQEAAERLSKTLQQRIEG
jgi:DNA-binding IclR family transcriptional regulator